MHSHCTPIPHAQSLFLWVYCIIISSIHHPPPLYVKQEVPMCGAAEINHLQSIRIHLFCLSLNEFEDKSVQNIPLTLLPARKNMEKILSCPLPLLSGCCLNSTIGCGPTGSGSPRATAGPTWRTTTGRSSPNIRTCVRLCPSHSASWSSGSCLRGELASARWTRSASPRLPICVFLMGAFIHQVSLPPPRLVATPLASLLGVRDKRRVCAAPNPVLEVYFCSTSKHPTQVSLPLILGNRRGRINAACPLEMTRQTT